jgi:hypothetical protein
VRYVVTYLLDFEGGEEPACSNGRIQMGLVESWDGITRADGGCH